MIRHLITTFLVAFFITNPLYAIPFVANAGIVASSEKAFIPTDIAGCELWLDANQITGLNDGDTVSTWSDESGESNDATQSTSSYRPTYQTNELNSLPVVRFDGTDDIMTVTNLGSVTGATGFIVVKIDNDPPTSGNGGLWKFSGAPSSGAFHYPFTDGNIYEGFGSTTRPSFGNPAFSLASWNIFEVVSANNDIRAYFNGTSFYSSSSNTVSFGVDDHTVGGSISTTNTYLDGDIAEIIIYDSALSTTDRQKVETYLNNKYSIY